MWVTNSMLIPRRLPQVLQQRHDRALHGDVQRRGDLVADQEVGLGGQRPRDRDPLPLAAGEPVGLQVEHGRAERHRVQQLDHLVPGRACPWRCRTAPSAGRRSARWSAAGSATGTGSGRCTGSACGPRRCASASPCRSGRPSNVSVAGPLLVQAADAPRDGGLAAAGLADQRHHLGLGDVEADAVHDLLAAVEDRRGRATVRMMSRRCRRVGVGGCCPRSMSQSPISPTRRHFAVWSGPTCDVRRLGLAGSGPARTRSGR